MADVLFMPNGSVEYIMDGTVEEFAALVQEYMGDDARAAFECVVENAVYDELHFTDEDDERVADGYLMMCLDACEVLEDLKWTFENTARLNRKALLKKVTTAYEALHNNL